MQTLKVSPPAPTPSTQIICVLYPVASGAQPPTVSVGPEGTLLVALGQSMPFFKSYQVKVDGAEVKDATSPLTWKLKPGDNTLQVAPVDEFGKVGLASSVTVNYAK